jgi:acetolactate synthase I/II/III large subunit
VNVAQTLCDQLAAWGVTHVFGVSGANIELVFDAAVRHDALDVVLAKHEAAATTMAMGYQERSGRLGVVLATSGGGAFNLLAPLTEALESGVPVLALVGQSPAGRDGTGAFQDSSGLQTPVDAERIFRTVAVSCRRVDDPSAAAREVRAAAVDAISAGGPAVVLLPRDVQSAQPGPMSPLPLPAATGPAAALLQDRLVDRLAEAVAGPVAPLIIAGRGALPRRARETLAALAASWGSPVAVAPDAKAAIDHGSRWFLGVAGVMGHEEVVDYARRATLCVLVGTRLPDVARHGLDDALALTTIVNVNPQPCFPALAGHPDVIDVPGPIAPVLAALRDRVPATFSPPAWATPPGAPSPAGPELSSAHVMERLAQAIEPGADVFVDAGNAGAFAVHLLPSDGRGLFSVALGMGGMGHAFGASIGAAVHSRRRTYVIAGDGSVYMHGFEVHTAIEYGLPIVYVVLNNNAHAMCRLREERLLTGDTGRNVFAPALLAGGMGAMFPGLVAREVLSLGDLDAALEETRGVRGPVFLSANVPPDEEPPFWPLASARPTESEVRT